MANKLPIYAQEGWGIELNNYLARMQSSIMSLQKQIDGITGDDTVTLTKFAGSGFTDTGMKLSYQDDTGIHYVVGPLNVTSLLHNTFTLQGGSLYYSASLYSDKGRLESLAQKPITFTFSSIFTDGETNTNTIPSAGTYAIVLKEFSNDQGELESKVVAVKSFKDLDDTISSNLNSWVDATSCRLGILSIFTIGKEENAPITGELFYKFTPAPFISLYPAGSKEDYLLNPVVQVTDLYKETLTKMSKTPTSLSLPIEYYYRLEGSDYFQALSANEKTVQLLTGAAIPVKDQKKKDDKNNLNIAKFLISSDKNNSPIFWLIQDSDNNDKHNNATLYSRLVNNFFNFDSTTNTPLYLTYNILYVVYLTNAGEMIVRKTTIDTSLLDSSQLLGSLVVDSFEHQYPKFTGIGAKECFRFALNQGNNKFVMYSANYLYSTPVFATSNEGTDWDLMGIKSTSHHQADSTTSVYDKVDNLSLFVLPEYKDVSQLNDDSLYTSADAETQKKLKRRYHIASLNISDEPSTIDYIPHILTYNNFISDVVNIKGKNTKTNNPALYYFQNSDVVSAYSNSDVVSAYSNSFPILKLHSTKEQNDVNGLKEEENVYSFLSPSVFCLNISTDLTKKDDITKDTKVNTGGFLIDDKMIYYNPCFRIDRINQELDIITDGNHSCFSSLAKGGTKIKNKSAELKLVGMGKELELSPTQLCITNPKMGSTFTFNNVSDFFFKHDVLNENTVSCRISDSSNSNDGQLQYEGEVFVNNLSVAGEITFTSDKRLKTNLHLFEKNALNILHHLPIYTYNLKNQQNTSLGILAQDLQKEMPELVEIAPGDGLADRLTIKETKLVFLCFKAIQELENKIKILEDKVYGNK